jgi:tetratricopeptide (TPR) repeat protein
MRSAWDNVNCLRHFFFIGGKFALTLVFSYLNIIDIIKSLHKPYAKRYILKKNKEEKSMYNIEKSEKFCVYIKEASHKLHNNKLEESYKIILKALKENPDAPEPQNLLGIFCELNGNSELARKHYRAAYALDPTYLPASENLERLCTLFSSRYIPINFGYKQTEN